MPTPLSRTARPPGYRDPGDRRGHSPARGSRAGSTRAPPPLAVETIDVALEDKQEPPQEDARAWDVQDVAAIVDECCEQAGLGACSELFLKHKVDGEVLHELLAAPAAELRFLGEGPGAACQATKTIAEYGARCKLHARLRKYVAQYTLRTQATKDAHAATKLEPDGRALLARLAGASPAYDLLDPTLCVGTSTKQAGAKQVVVPVHLTLMIKKLVADRQRATLVTKKFIQLNAYSKREPRTTSCNI